jgi:hypothetical protein
LKSYQAVRIAEEVQTLRERAAMLRCLPCFTQNVLTVSLPGHQSASKRRCVVITITASHSGALNSSAIMKIEVELRSTSILVPPIDTARTQYIKCHCVAPPEDDQVMLDTRRGPQFVINWVKRASRWFRYTRTDTACFELRDIRLSPPSNWSLRSSGMLRSVDWCIVTDVSEQPFGPVFKIGPIGCPETSLANYLSTLCDIP